MPHWVAGELARYSMRAGDALRWGAPLACRSRLSPTGSVRIAPLGPLRRVGSVVTSAVSALDQGLTGFRAPEATSSATAAIAVAVAHRRDRRFRSALTAGSSS